LVLVSFAKVRQGLAIGDHIWLLMLELLLFLFLELN